VNLENKVAIVTGGSRGIGRAIVERLSREGADVVFTYNKSSDEAESLLEKLAGMNKRALAVQADVNSFEKANEVVLKAVDTFGRIDILVNNAGITRDKSLILMGQDEWKETIDTNLTGVFNYTRSVILKMFRQRSGDVVNVTSYSGVFGAIGQSNYSASKAGVIGFTKALAREVAPYNIRVNAIAPGFVETEMVDELPEKLKQDRLRSIPLGRFGKPEEVAGVVCFLVSQDASYITGQVLGINGGMGM
jgi:3-oxoacyl-[acyl-carrier protein] reductase